MLDLQWTGAELCRRSLPQTCTTLLLNMIDVERSTVICIESLARAYTHSLTGYLIWPLCTRYFVQSPTLERKAWPWKREYHGLFV